MRRRMWFYVKKMKYMHGTSLSQVICNHDSNLQYDKRFDTYNMIQNIYLDFFTALM